MGTVQECKKRIQQYEKMVVFTGKYDLEGMMESTKTFSDSSRVFDAAIKPYLDHYIMFCFK